MSKLKVLFLSLLTLSLSLSIKAGDLKKNTINSEFRMALAAPSSEAIDGFIPGGIPFPIRLGYSTFKGNGGAKYPDYYDLRDLGMVPPVKTQSNGGCWAYSSMSTMESRMLMLGEGLYDLSDNNLKYCHGFFPSRSTYGNAWMTTAYFARQSGPLLEEQDPYPGGTSEPGVDCPVGEAPAFYVRDARYPEGDMNTIKQLVMDVGSVWSLFYFNNAYFDPTDNTYFYGGTHTVNHVTNIVGWDDNRITAGGVGAWICQNTWGTGWGENGFFYISYNDSQLLIYNAYFPNAVPYDTESRVLLYDELGNYNSAGYGPETGYALVKYPISENIFIEEIGTYAMAYGTTIEMEVYSDFDEASGVLSNQIAAMSSQVTEHPGFYTFPLDNAIPVQTGDVVYVKVKYTTPGYEWPIPIEEFIEDYADPQIESDVAWTSEDGQVGNWDKIGANTEESWDLCINIYGQNNPLTIPLSNNAILIVFAVLALFYSLRMTFKP